LIFRASIDTREYEIDMPFRMNRDGPQSLHVTMNGLNRGSKQLRHLLLRLAQFLSDGHEFLAIHYLLHKKFNHACLESHNVVYLIIHRGTFVNKKLVKKCLTHASLCGIFYITVWHSRQRNISIFFGERLVQEM